MSSINKSSFNIKEDNEFPYISPCMRCQPIIDFTTLRFNSKKNIQPIKIFNDEESDNIFGILDIKIRGEIPITSKHIHIFFTIDASGSMSDICSDGRSKMAHIHHTLENMLRIFHENKSCDISIHVQSFDSIVKTIIKDIEKICDTDLEILIKLLKKITPGESTDIELALRKASEEITKYNLLNPSHEVIHIFLTDGDITAGSDDNNLLLDLVPKNCANIFIGYGIEHDSELLSYLSRNKGNEYRFIDALEKAGLVYGEIIHSILYRAIEDIKLTAYNGELYDFQSNKWLPEIEIGNLSSEQKKTFHVRSKNIKDFHVSIFGKTIIKTRQFQNINIYETQLDVSPIHNILNNSDLDIYLFRQKTQELLYESRKFSEYFRKNNSIKPIEDILYTELQDQQMVNIKQMRNIKQKLNDFHKTMLNYMKEKSLENNSMMKMLCDDIYIAYKTIGTSFGTMYTCARQTSNGRQHTYICSASNTCELFNNTNTNINKRIPKMLKLQRQTNNPISNFSEETDITKLIDIIPDDLANFAPSQDFLSPFSSDGVVRLMREVSGNNSIGSIESDNQNL